MPRCFPALVRLAAFVIPAVITLARAHAFGPGVHIREVDRYAELHPEWSAPELLPYLRLGAVFPDIRGAGIALPLNSHDKTLGDAIAAVADASGEPWQRAFALGYRLHTASDCVAQVHYIPWLTAATDLQVVNLFGAEDIAPEGDNELLIEGFGDLRSGDLAAFVDIVWYFVHEHPDALDRVIDLFIAGLEQRTDGAADEPAIRAGMAAFWERLRTTLPAGAKEQFLSLVTAARDWDLEAVIGLFQVGPLGELLGGLPAAPEDLALDPSELERLDAHLVGRDPGAFFAAYDERFADLGARILDDPAYRPWPWYHGQTIIAAVVAGLGRTVPGLAPRPEVLLYDAGFAEDAAEVVAHAELFLAFGEPVTVRLEVVADPPGILARPTAADVLGAATGTVRAGPERTRLEVRFTPRASGVEAHHLVFFADDDERPFLTSDWDLVAAYADAPLFRAPYRDGYAGFPPAYPRRTEAVDVDWGWVRGHAIAGPRGIAADIFVDGAVAARARPGGPYLVEPLTPGPHAFSARATGWGALPFERSVEPGRLTVVDLPLEPTPIVRDGPPWSVDAGALAIAWSSDHLPAGSACEVAVGDETHPETYAAWRGAGADATEAVVTLDAPVSDGTALYGWVRAAGGPPARGAPTFIDASPPIVRIAQVTCLPTVSLALTAEEPHSPVVAIEARLGEEAWRTADPDGAIGWGRSGGPFTVSVRARNAADLESAIVTQEVCAPAPVDASAAHADEGCASGGAGPTWTALLVALFADMVRRSRPVREGRR